MKSSSASDPWQHPHADHLHKIAVLCGRAINQDLSQATRDEARAELTRYRDQGMIIQKYGRELKVAKRTRTHEEPQTFAGQGILFAVIDDREAMRDGKVTTIDVITEAIEAALDAGHETSEDIARYLTTSAFQHVTDKRVRFNSILKAGDAVGAQMTRKLYNAYTDLATMVEETEDPTEKASLKAEATGFAEALQIVISPFSSEEPTDPRMVNWEEVDRMTESFEKEQRFVRKERKGNPQ